MPDLNLGVIDVAYDNGGVTHSRPNKTGRSKTTSAEPTTTVAVANFLEAKYHVLQVFYDHYEGEIGKAVIHSLEGALEDLYAGAPIRDPFGEAGQEIEQGFRQFLLTGEIESLGLEGVPTQAAIERRSGRFKSGVGPAQRPSFVNTATYELAFRSWVDG